MLHSTIPSCSMCATTCGQYTWLIIQPWSVLLREQYCCLLLRRLNATTETQWQHRPGRPIHMPPTHRAIGATLLPLASPLVACGRCCAAAAGLECCGAALALAQPHGHQGAQQAQRIWPTCLADLDLSEEYCTALHSQVHAVVEAQHGVVLLIVLVLNLGMGEEGGGKSTAIRKPHHKQCEPGSSTDPVSGCTTAAHTLLSAGQHITLLLH